MNGVQVGTDLYRTRRTQAGFLFGYEGGQARAASDRVDADDIYIGVYGARVLRGGADIRGTFAYGWQNFDMSRLSEETNVYTSKFRGYTTEANVEIGKRRSWGAWSLRPALGLDTMSRHIGATQENVGPDSIAYGKTSLSQVFLRGGTELRYQMKRLTVTSGMFYAYDVNGERLSTTAVNDGIPFQIEGASLGREQLTYSVGGSYQWRKNVSLFGGYDGGYVCDTRTAQHTGYVGGSWRW
jgi:uncharacterized protein with beta-barrel porin domain